MRFLTPLLALTASAQAALLTLQSPRLTVTSADGSQLRSDPISLTQKASPVTIGPKDTLKVTFQVVTKDGGKGVQPHQTFLRFYDPVSKEEGVQPVRVTAGGKAKFELNMAKPPSSLPPTSTTPLQVTLIIGSSQYSPLQVSLFDLTVPESHPAPVHSDEASFHLLPEIQHTFQPEQKLPPQAVSAFFAGIVLAPWVVLFGMWSQTSYAAPNLFAPAILPFTASLGAFEALLLWYWVDLKLGQVLLYGSILGVVTLFTGKTALASIATRRLMRK